MARNPYVQQGRQLPSIIAFLGILNFFARVTEAHQQDRADALLQELHQCLGQARQFFQNGTHHRVKLFSDQVVLGMPIDPTHRDPIETAVTDTLTMAAAYQFVLAVHGFFTAGGITKDLHYADELQAFGRGLVDTAGLWYSADVPCLRLHQRLGDWVRCHVKQTDAARWTDLDRWLLVDEEGAWFVNYLAQSDPECNGTPREDWLQQHAEHIRNLPRNKPEGLMLFRWLAAYHNWFCRQYPDLPTSLQVHDPTDQLSVAPHRLGRPLRVSEWLKTHGQMEA